MNKEFEQWLKQDDLYEYFLNNPKQRKDIFKDFQREKEYINPNSKNDWIEWFVNNPELAKKHYPLLSKELTDRIKNSPPYETANIIQKLPEYFYLWKSEINLYTGKYREKRVELHIALLKLVLHESEYPDEIEQLAVESVRDELQEQLEFWIKDLTSQQTKTEKIIKRERPEKIEDFFYNTKLIVPCINVLKQLEPPLIDSECNYIGKLKGGVCVWLEEMKRQGVIKHYSDRKIYATLLPQLILGFYIDESMLGKHHKRAEEKYKTDIKTLISKVKLSQDSHL